MNLTTEKINGLLGIKESYQASDKLIKILLDKEKREDLFKRFLEIETNMTTDWFHIYFEEEHANKLKYAQDFTPMAVAELVSKLVVPASGTTLEVAAGSGGMLINKWNQDRLAIGLARYKPSLCFYKCEELSDRAMPFLLFNMAIRGMNGTVVHGDAVSREAKQVYFLKNTKDDFLGFSDLNVLPHSEMCAQEFDIRKWVEPEIDHIESPNPWEAEKVE